jgi:hypothetical protein
MCDLLAIACATATSNGRWARGPLLSQHCNRMLPTPYNHTVHKGCDFARPAYALHTEPCVLLVYSLAGLFLHIYSPVDWSPNLVSQ